MICALFSFVFFGCDNEETNRDTTIKGKLVWFDTQEPIGNAEIEIAGSYQPFVGGGSLTSFTKVVSTDADGKFSLNLVSTEIPSETQRIGVYSLYSKVDGLLYDYICYIDCPRDNPNCNQNRECSQIEVGKKADNITIELLRGDAE